MERAARLCFVSRRDPHRGQQTAFCDLVRPYRFALRILEFGLDPHPFRELVQRVAGASLREMQNVIWELESLRDFLQSEGERVQREISSYAQLTQAAMSSTRNVADSMVPWKKVSESKRVA